MNILDKLVGGLTNSVTAKAKDSALSTLKDPEFKATINQFTKDWAFENRYVLIPVVGGFILLSVLAIINIITNLRVR
jgi:hypothetical protein